MAIESRYSKLVALIIFGMAFGFVEAAVVVYLRRLLGIGFDYSQLRYQVLLNLGAIVFIKPIGSILPTGNLQVIETVREAATIIMLGSVAFLSSLQWKQRFGAFLVAFAMWDLFYYIWLYALIGWPKSLLDIDVYFLIPVPWIGPVATPVVISLALLLSGGWLYTLRSYSIDVE